MLHAKLTSSLYQITSQWPYPKQILLFNTCGDIVPQVSRAAQLVDFTVAGVGYSPTSVMASSSDDYDALQQPRYGYGYGSDQQSSHQPYPFQDGYRPSSSYTSGYPALSQQGPPPHTGYYGGSTYPGGPPLSYRPDPNPRLASPEEKSGGIMKKIFGRKRSKSTSSSSSSSSSDSDSSTKKNKKNNSRYATVPRYTSDYGPYLFSVFCPNENPETIVLEVVDAGSGHDLLVGPNQDTSHPAYKIEYDNENDFKAYRCNLPLLNPNEAEFAGQSKWHSMSERHDFKFPWGRWSHKHWDEWWSSDVGFLEGKADMKWYLLETTTTYATNNFVARCFDTSTPGMPATASFYMRSYSTGRLELPVRLFRTQEQLDEVVVVAFAVMCSFRDYVRDNPGGKETDNARKTRE